VEGYYLRENMTKCVQQSRQVFEVFWWHCCIYVLCDEDLTRCIFFVFASSLDVHQESRGRTA
jgi:hypothetical protein